MPSQASDGDFSTPSTPVARKTKKPRLAETALSPEKAPAPDTEKPKPRRRAFDAVAAQNKLMDRVGQEKKQAQSALEKSIQDAKDAQAKGKDLSEDEWRVFKAYFDTIETRQELVDHVLNNKSGAVRAKVEELTSKNTNVIDDQGSLLHIDDFFFELEDQVRACQDEDDIKQAAKAIKGKGALMKRLASALTRSTGDVKRAMEQKQKKAVSDLEKRRKADEAKKKKDQQDMMKKLKKAQGSGSDDMSCMWLDDFVGKLYNRILVYEDQSKLTDAFKSGQELHDGKMYIFKPAKTAKAVMAHLEKNTVKGALQIFEAQFPISNQARQHGRVQTVFKLEGAEKVKEAARRPSWSMLPRSALLSA